MKLLDYLFWDEVTTDRLNFYRAIGVDSLMIHLPEEMGDGKDYTEDFKRMKNFVEEHGLELFVYHAHRIPRDKIIYGQPGRDEQIETWCDPSVL